MNDAWVHTAALQQVHVGAGSLRRLSELLRVLGVRRVLLLTTEGRRASEEGARVERILGRTVASVFDGCRPHLPTDVARAAVQHARRDGIDGVVSFGGGSVVDAAKAVNFFLEQEGGAPAVAFSDRPALWHVAIPTTYAGAVGTPWFAMTDPRTGVKAIAGGPTCVPVAIVADPELTRSMPREVTAQSGMEAIAHCVEVLSAHERSPEAESVARAALEALAGALVTLVADEDDATARATAAGAAAMAARALPNAAPSAHRVLARLLAGRTNMPQGLADSVLLPHVMRFNAEAVPEAMATIASVLGGPTDAAAAVEALAARLGLPARLRDCDVGESALDAVARLAGGSPELARNPRPCGEADARAILADAW